MTEPSTHTTSTPVLFLGGAGLPGWVWDDVRAQLPASTESLVARYPRAASASLADYADTAADQAPWPAFAVVAHSIGGVVAVELLARHHARVTGFLAVTAVVPRPDESFIDTLPVPSRFLVRAMLRLAGTRPPDRLIRAGVASGVAPATADRIVGDFEPEAVGLYRDRTSARDLPSVRAYLHTTADKELSADVQGRSAQTLEARWTQELPTGHLPMLEAPDAVTSALRRLLSEIDGGSGRA